jgi:hypothetical protein
MTSHTPARIIPGETATNVCDCGPTVTRDNADPDPAVGDTSVADPHGQLSTQCDGSNIAIGGKRIVGAKGRFRFLLDDVDLDK